MAARLLVIAAGGTGGHMFPAQALAEAMLAKGWRVKLSTDERGARFTGGFPKEVTIETLASATFARGGFAAKLMVLPRIVSGALGAMRANRRDRPDIVVGFGGYPSIPAITAAYLMRLPRMVHEQNGVLGRVNEVFSRGSRVQAVACGTWPTEVKGPVRKVHTGNPVRAAILDRAGAGYIPPGDYPMSILVTGGSQAARVLSKVVPAAIAALPDTLRNHLRISHQARPEDLSEVEAFYAASGIRADVRTFFNDMPNRISEAQLIVARSGASTVADIAVIGRPAIFVPLAAAIRDEQTANARALVEAGGALLIREADLDPKALSEHMAAILSDPARATKMASAALSCGMPDATQRLVSLVQELAGQPTGKT